ncbi:MAG: sigma-70 family RNA polymerase sigma factor [Chloroflexi bacterium]|nr:sigma-70 family RNA polymerase sigma factor [Chloroflexota bacterium]
MIMREAIAVQQARESHSLTFEAIFAQYQDPIYRYVYRMMGNADDAGDLTQDTFLKAYLALPKMPVDLNVGPWLYRIATNTCLDELRRRKIVRWTPWDDFMAVFHPKQVAGDNPEKESLRREDAEEVQRTLARIHPRYRTCLLLKEYEDFSCNEIAAVMGISPGAVKSLLFRAREAFREAHVGDKATRVKEGSPSAKGRVE